ncbi:MAG: tetratricopeptide repeat protein [Bryobacterales bacterium]|nr:tetratricopeptide repeat protein [Bryobacterales bacterium]
MAAKQGTETRQEFCAEKQEQYGDEERFQQDGTPRRTDSWYIRLSRVRGNSGASTARQFRSSGDGRFLHTGSVVGPRVYEAPDAAGESRGSKADNGHDGAGGGASRSLGFGDSGGLQLGRQMGGDGGWGRNGDALMRFGKRTEAVRLLEKARAAGPRNPAVLNALAVHHATQGRLAKAIELLEKARASNPDHPLTWINLGVSHEAMGSADRALKAYLEAIRLQPDSSEARRRLASLQ